MYPRSDSQSGPSTFGIWILTALFLLAYSCFAASDSELSPDSIPPLKPVHPELPPTFWEQYGLWVILGGVLVLLLGGVAAWLLTRPRLQSSIPPAVQARRMLEPLRQKPEDGAVLTQVSQAVQHYFVAAFNLPPGEFTTAEFCRMLAKRQEIGPALAEPLTGLLRQCDERKFAPAQPPSPLGAAAAALKLIDQAEARRTALAEAAKAPRNA